MRKRYNQKELELISKLYSQGKNAKEIAFILKREYTGVTVKIRDLKLEKPKPINQKLLNREDKIKYYNDKLRSVM